MGLWFRVARRHAVPTKIPAIIASCMSRLTVMRSRPSPAAGRPPAARNPPDATTAIAPAATDDQPAREIAPGYGPELAALHQAAQDAPGMRPLCSRPTASRAAGE